MTGWLDMPVRIDFAPLVPMPWLIALAVMAAAALIVSMFAHRRSALWRTACALVFLLALSGPSLVEEQREAVKDVAVIVADRSPSQIYGARAERTRTAREALEKELAQNPDLEVRVVEAPSSDEAVRQTDLFAALDRAFADTPPGRRAGAILLTDGQVHDIPESAPDYGPIHALLSGDKNETDRQIVITGAPTYGIVGQSIGVTFKVDDSDAGGARSVNVIVRRDQEQAEILSVPVGAEQTIEFPVDHGGKNILELEAAPLDGELTAVNNKAAIVVNGVRDRLRVLLVSGRPHAGGRTWRDLLTSDPAVDLVHFTILRDPEKLDMTPQNELSLIPFPFHELFEVKLHEFDLIIFDRYSLNKVLPPYYFANIVRYVEDGGALLEASGPEYASAESLYQTVLGPILPGRPTGLVMENYYRPGVTALGRRHPVTENLVNAGGGRWGGWLRQVDLKLAGQSDVIMTGAAGAPLLMLSHVGEGRVAQLASDQIWLWARGYDGGGPQGELLRRLAHWLMKEPELEEDMLELQPDGNALLIRRRSLREQDAAVTLTRPDGTRAEIELAAQDDSPFLQARADAPLPGVYAATDGTHKALTVIGDITAPEFKAILSSPDPLSPVAKDSGGTVRWLADGVPAVRFLSGGRKYGGNGWIGLRRNEDYTVTGMKVMPVLPLWLLLAMLGGGAVWAWWRESRG